MRLARNSLGVVTRNSLGVVARNPLGVVAKNRMGLWQENSMELWKIFDKIRPVGWITLTRFLFNRNIFPLTR